MKKIIICGATSGLGRGLAERFLQQGWQVGATGRHIDALDELASKWPGQLLTRKIDITQTEAAARLDELIRAMGGMDVYLHCSGVLPFNEALDEDKELQTVATNVDGFTRMVSAAYRYFRSSARPGRLAAITSIAGIRGVGQLASYCASKSYGSTYLEALRQLAHIDGLPLRVIDIRPGWVRTPLLKADCHYSLEMPAPKAVDLIFRAVNNSSRGHIIGARWRLLCGLERMVPAWIWQRLNLRQWSPAAN